MNHNLEKDSFNETSLPTTEYSFAGLKRTSTQQTAQQTTIQQPSHKSETQQPIVPQQISQCRICLQSQEQSGQPFITPCHCIGSVRYIHLTCFTEWIRTSLTNKQKKQLQEIQQQGLKCDLCKMSLQISMCMERVFVDFARLKQRIKKNALYFSVLTFMLISTIVLLCISAAKLPQSPFTFPSQLNSPISDVKDKALQKVTMLCSLIVAILVLIMIAFLLFRDFLITYKMKVWSSGKDNMKIELKGILQS